jgi:hypothetical protein
MPTSSGAKPVDDGSGRKMATVGTWMLERIPRKSVAPSLHDEPIEGRVFLGRRAPRIVGRSRHLGRGVPEGETLHALGVGGRVHRAQPAAVRAGAPQHGVLGSDGVEDRANVIHPRLQVGKASRAV